MHTISIHNGTIASEAAAEVERILSPGDEAALANSPVTTLRILRQNVVGVPSFDLVNLEFKFENGVWQSLYVASWPSGAPGDQHYLLPPLPAGIKALRFPANVILLNGSNKIDIFSTLTAVTR